MQILILANHSGGLYDFRKDLIAALKQHAEVSVAVPHNCLLYTSDAADE